MAKTNKMVAELTQASDEVDTKKKAIDAQKKQIEDLQIRISTKEAKIAND